MIALVFPDVHMDRSTRVFGRFALAAPHPTPCAHPGRAGLGPSALSGKDSLLSFPASGRDAEYASRPLSTVTFDGVLSGRMSTTSAFRKGALSIGPATQPGQRDGGGRAGLLLVPQPRPNGPTPTVRPIRPLTNIRPMKGTAMAQTLHPLDSEVLDMHDTRNALIHLFSSDGVICGKEREALHRFEGHRRTISGYRLREIAADGLKRNGLTKLVRRQFRDADIEIVDLNAQRQVRRSNVVQFRGRDDGETA